MGTSIYLSKTEFIKILQEKNILLFTFNDLFKLFPIKSKNTAKHLIRRLKKEGIIRTLISGKYLFTLTQPKFIEYRIANFLYQPSYISLETALSYYGLLSQFPYQVISVTAGKSKKTVAGSKTYIYSQIKKELYTGFVKTDDFLIASEEKAIFDAYYFVKRGLRNPSILEEVPKNKLKEAIEKFETFL